MTAAIGSPIAPTPTTPTFLTIPLRRVRRAGRDGLRPKLRPCAGSPHSCVYRGRCFCTAVSRASRSVPSSPHAAGAGRRGDVSLGAGRGHGVSAHGPLCERLTSTARATHAARGDAHGVVGRKRSAVVGCAAGARRAARRARRAPRSASRRRCASRRRETPPSRRSGRRSLFSPGATRRRRYALRRAGSARSMPRSSSRCSFHASDTPRSRARVGGAIARSFRRPLAMFAMMLCVEFPDAGADARRGEKDARRAVAARARAASPSKRSAWLAVAADRDWRSGSAARRSSGAAPGAGLRAGPARPRGPRGRAAAFAFPGVAFSATLTAGLRSRTRCAAALR